MKKDRNAFFNEYNMASMNIPTPNMMPNPIFSANSSVYSGPMNPNMYSDLDSRLSKIERTLNRLETRINNLENGTNYSDSYNSNSMYMV